MTLKVLDLKGQLDWKNVYVETYLLDQNYKTINMMNFRNCTIDEYKEVVYKIRENAENLIALVDNAVVTYNDPEVEMNAYRCDDCLMMFPRSREQCLDCGSYNVSQYYGKYKYEPIL